MATSVNIGDDVKSYLSSNGGADGNSSVTSSIGKMFQGNNVKGWFYSPLNNADSDDVSVNGDLTGVQSTGASRSGSTASFLPNWLPGNSQPSEPSWLPSLVSLDCIN